MNDLAFTSGKSLLTLCNENNCSISQIMRRRETVIIGSDEEQVRDRMKKTWRIMKRAVEKGLQSRNVSLGNLVGGEAEKLFKSPLTILGERAGRAAAMAMAAAEVNASMGLIVAAPTAGSCGVLPGVLHARDYPEEDIVDALFTASAVGMIIQINASVSGAIGGCQAEIGTASAMAAAALAELNGGTPKTALDAAAMALQNLMGLVCDPVAGLVEVPCVKRNAIGAINALLCADMALCGITSLIPFDETVDAMYRVGCSLPQSLKESAQGGIAATPTAKAIERDVFSAGVSHFKQP